MPVEPQPEETLSLVFEGIDTFAEIYLNGKLVAHTENMLIPHRIEMADIPKRDEPCVLCVRIKSDQFEVSKRDFDGVVELVGNDPSRIWIRKGAYTHGWDIFPRLLSAGIWRDAYLELEAAYGVKDVFVFTKKFGVEQSVIMARVTIQCPRVYRSDLKVRFRLLEEDSEVYAETYAMQFPLVFFRFNLDNPRLWWPCPYGTPFMYRYEVELIQGDETLDRYTGNFGVRSVELTREPMDEGRESFYFKINETPISVFGSNHVPLDSFPSRHQARLPRALELIDESKCNMLRVWGGGVYESRDFYDACDRMGVMVWQEFMFSCGLYPQEEAFLEQVRSEARHVLRSLRNHPSVIIYSGDNEIETHLSHYFSKYQADGNRAIAHELLPEYVMRHDGTRPYWPSSPYTDMEGEPAYSQKGGDTHIWCHGLYYKNPVYSSDQSPFISEIGHLAIPNLESLEKFISRKHLWPRNSQVWGYRCGSLSDPTFYGFPDGRLKSIDKNILNVFGEIPGNLDDMIFASQFVQAEAYKFWIERARRRKFDCGGILWWNLLDGCPQCSDAAVDYFMNKKMAFDFIRRVQEDLLLCIDNIEGKLHLFAVNENREDLTVEYGITTEQGFEMEGRCIVPPNKSICIGSIDEAAEHPRLFLISGRVQDRQYFNHYLDGNPPFALDTLRNFAAQIHEHSKNHAQLQTFSNQLA